MERFLIPKKPAKKMATVSATRTEPDVPAGGGEGRDHGNDMLPFSPSSDLSPCLPRSLSLPSLGSPGGEPSGSLQWASQGIQHSQQQSSIIGVHLPLSQQASMRAAPLTLPLHEPPPVLNGEQALWALLQKLPTRDDLDSGNQNGGSTP